MQPVPRQGARRRARRAPHLPQQDVRRRRLAAVARRLCARLGLRRRTGAAAQRRSAAAPPAACRTDCRRTSTPPGLRPCRGERAPRAPAAGLRIGAGAAGRRNAGAGSPAGAGGWSGAVCGCGSRASLAVAALQAARALGPHQRPRERHVLAPAPSAPWFGRRQQPSLPSKRGLQCVLSSGLQDAMVGMSCACGDGLLYATAGWKNCVASAESTGGATCQGRCRGILPREQSVLACASARRTGHGQLLQMRQLVTFVVALQAPRTAQIPVRVTRRRTQHRADAARTWAPGRAANADVQCGACKTPA